LKQTIVRSLSEEKESELTLKNPLFILTKNLFADICNSFTGAGVGLKERAKLKLKFLSSLPGKAFHSDEAHGGGGRSTKSKFLNQSVVNSISKGCCC
jgi:hypothetical protein